MHIMHHVVPFHSTRSLEYPSLDQYGVMLDTWKERQEFGSIKEEGRLVKLGVCTSSHRGTESNEMKAPPARMTSERRH
jgi:hypothetical protein